MRKHLSLAPTVTRTFLVCRVVPCLYLPLPASLYHPNTTFLSHLPQTKDDTCSQKFKLFRILSPWSSFKDPSPYSLPPKMVCVWGPCGKKPQWKGIPGS